MTQRDIVTPRDIARQEWANCNPYYRDAVTLLQAKEVGRDLAYWPPACEHCGAQWKLTPKGRWLMDHFPHEMAGPLPDLERPRRPYADD
jgi:hypothetical protein